MSMLMRLPKHVPPLDVVLHDIFNPTPAALAKALGVTEQTVKRWIAKNEAPKPVMLALFWLTRWGMQWCDADLYNEAQLHFAMNRCQALKIREMKTKLDRMARIGNFGSANDPAEGVALPPPEGAKVVQLHMARRDVQGVPAKASRLAPHEAPGFIRARPCKPPTGYHHFMRKKGRAA